MSIGSKIKSLRESSGLTQDELARRLGTKKQTIYKYENDIVSNIPLEKIEILSSIFNVSPSYLTGWEGDNDSKGSNEPILNQRNYKDIALQLEAMREQLSTQEGLMFDGEPASPEAIEAILNAMELGMQAAKQRNKEKFTPKKYRKE